MTTLLAPHALDHAIAQRDAHMLDAIDNREAADTLDALGMFRAAAYHRATADKLDAWAQELTTRISTLTNR